jgi:hypothetical protein
MEKLATIMPTVGKTAQLAGVSLEKTAALAGTLTDRGLDASSAATSLRNIFLELSKKGITWDEAMTRINESTDKNKTSMDLFGKRAAAAGVILSETGESVDGLTSSLIKAEGAAQDMADTMLDNLAGDITIAQSAWEGFILSLEDGEGTISKVMRGLVQDFTDFLGQLTKFNETTVENKLKLIANAALNLFEKAFLPLASLLRKLGIEFPKFRFELEETAKISDDLAFEVKKGTGEIKKQGEEIKKFTKTVGLANKVLRTAGYPEQIQSITEVGQFTVDNAKKTANDIAMIGDTHRETEKNKRLKHAEEVAEAENQILLQARASAVQLASDIFDSFVDARLAKSKAEADAQKKILQDRLDKGLISEQEFADKTEQIEKEQRIKAAKAEKKKAIFDIAIATALAVAKAGFITPAAIAIAAIGAIQAAVIAVKPIPEFAEGEVNIQGKPHSQGGINANIEGGESVINKRATSQSEGLLNAINSGLITDRNFASLSNTNNFDTLERNTSLTNMLLQNGLGMVYTEDGFLVRKLATGKTIKKRL